MDLEQKAKQTINEHILKLSKSNFISEDVIRSQYCFESNIRSNSEKVKIQVYFGKKGIKTVLQGDTASSLYDQIQEILFGNNLFTQKIEVNEPLRYIGVDESGKGDYFGPLVTAAVYIDENTNVELQKANVKDSKELSDTQILLIAKKIKKIIGDKSEILSLPPKMYNQLYEKDKNLNKLLAQCHSEVMRRLLIKAKCNEVISDKFGKSETLLHYINEKKLNVNLIQIPRAEKFIAVAAASILAREKVILWFEQIKQKTGIELNKGGSNLKPSIDKFVTKFGKEKLIYVAKLHFKTTKNI